MDDLSLNAAEAMSLDSASNRDAASDRDASMRQLEKFTTEAKALTAERLSLKTPPFPELRNRVKHSVLALFCVLTSC